MKTNNMVYTAERNNVVVKIRLNDEWKNGHNDFAITGMVYNGSGRRERDMISCGCCHEEILKEFPEFDIFVRLHLSDSKGVPTRGINNSFYYLRTGKIERLKKDLRCTDEQLEILKHCTEKYYFQYMIEKLLLPFQWENEAKEAISMLEKLTGNTFIDDSIKLNYTPLSEDQNEKIRKLIDESFYSMDSIEERRKKEYQSKNNQILSKLVDEQECKINSAQKQKECFEELKSIDIDIYTNCIYYGHKKTFAFNWKSYEPKIGLSDFNDFCESHGKRLFGKYGVSFEVIIDGLIIDVNGLERKK